MVRVIIERKMTNFVRFQELSKKAQSRSWRGELHKGVIDAARKTRTRVQKAVKEQMGVAPGSYQSYVVRNMRFRSNQADLSATISASAKGGQITDFKGLRSLGVGGRAARVANRGRSFPGQVKSAVWNAPRVFQRSFMAASGGYFALIRASGARGNSTMPKAFWTHDSRSWQARDGQGQFAKMGAQKWRVRRLRGPAIGKELDKGQSLQVFLSYGPAELERQVMRRVERIMKW